MYFFIKRKISFLKEIEIYIFCIYKLSSHAKHVEKFIFEIIIYDN